MTKKFFWMALATVLMLATPLMVQRLGVSPDLAQHTFLLWFIIPGIIYGFSQKNPLLSTQTPRRYDRYQQ